MNMLLLEGLPVASLVGAEAFVVGFSVIWAAFSAIGFGEIAVLAALAAGGIALFSAVWAIYTAMRTSYLLPTESQTE